MSLTVKNTFLELPLQNALELYNKHVDSKVSKKNQVIAISTAVALSVIYYIREKVLKPPKKLRHIPYQSYYSVIKSILDKDTFWDRAYSVTLPQINTKESNGFYMKPGRFGWELHVADAEAAKRVLLKIDLFPKVDAITGNEGTLITKFFGGPNIVLLNGHRWKNQRKVANPAFHRSQPVKLFGKLTQEMFQVMKNTEGDTYNVSDLMERWTLEAIGKAGFGFDFNAISDANNEMVKTYNIVNDSLKEQLYFLFPSLDKYFLWALPKRRAAHRALDRFNKMLNQVIVNKKNDLANDNCKNDALEDNERDLLSLLIENSGEGEALSDIELKSNLAVFFFAGHDTTANALSFAIHYLAKYPDIQEKARKEAIEVLGDAPYDVLPGLEDIKKFTYINQVIKENLRINGPAAQVIIRKSTEDTELGGIAVPKNTYLTVDIFNIMHNEKYWNDSQEFNPDRFAEENRSGQESSAWLPFGNGGRQCIGMNFSLNEQRVMLAMLLRKFTWHTPENSIHKEKLVTSGFGVMGPYKLDMTFKERY